jgi:hypothetical protein
MNGAQIVRQEISQYGRAGQDVLVRQAFMQFQLAFMKDGCLRAMKGAPLAAFVAVGLHEVEIYLGQADPFTLSDIMMETGYSKPVAVSALDYLVENRFIEELPGRGRNREKQYRVASYMWFGSGKTPSHKSRANAPAAKSKENELVERDEKNLDARDRSVVVKNESSAQDSEIQQQQPLPAPCPSRYSAGDLDRIKSALWALGIWENAWIELLGLSWMSVAYAEDWIEHKRREGQRLTGAFYRKEMRAGHRSPYPSPPAEEYQPMRRSDFTDAEWDRLHPLNRKLIEMESESDEHTQRGFDDDSNQS